jgi:hypothetical protein
MSSHRDYLLYIQFFRTRHPLYLLLYVPHVILSLSRRRWTRPWVPHYLGQRGQANLTVPAQPQLASSDIELRGESRSPRPSSDISSHVDLGVSAPANSHQRRNLPTLASSWRELHPREHIPAPAAAACPSPPREH